MKYTDKFKGHGVHVSAALHYSKDKTIQQNLAINVNIIKRALPEFAKILKIPRDLQFRVCSIKGRTLGRYINPERLIEIDGRLPWNKFLEILAHELVHAEQYHTGKLKVEYLRGCGYILFWNGRAGKKGTTYNSYRNQPWEVEAYDRQAVLAEQVCSILEKKYP